MLLEPIRAFAPRFTHKSVLPKLLWGEALRHGSWPKTHTATHVLGSKMPFETLFGKPSDLMRCMAVIRRKDRAGYKP